MMQTRKFARKLSLLACLSLLVALFAAPAASADELSDAKASLANATTKLSSLTTALTNATNDLTTLTGKLNATDTSTADGPAIYASLQSQIDTAKAVKATIESQIPAAQTDVNTWTSKVATITAAINAANNCPADWGLTPANFSEGIDVGNFYFNNKVMTEINKDQRSTVVSTIFQISKDGTNWTNYTQIPSPTWINYANNLRYTASPQYMGVLKDAYTLLKYSNSRVRTLTTLDKQNCVTYSLESDSKALTTAAIPFSKTSIEELYTAYPQAFPNYQVRDQAIAAIASIKTDLANVAGGGTQYSFNKGYLGNFQLVTYPRSGSCNGDINTANVSFNAACELGIYWLYNNLIKYVDSVSVVGGQSEAVKQQVAMKLQLVTLAAAAQKIYDNYLATNEAFNTLANRYSENPSSISQQDVNNAVGFSSTFNSLYASGLDTQNQINTIIASQYINQDLVNLASPPRGILGKIIPQLMRFVDISKNFVTEISNALNATSADQAKETSKANAYAAMASTDLQTANSIMQTVIDKWNKGFYKSITQTALNVETSDLAKLRSMYTERSNTANQIISQLNSSISNSRNSTEAAGWRSIQAKYSSIVNSYGNALAALDKATSYYKMVQPTGSVEAQNELAKATTAMTISNSEVANLKSRISNYEQIIIAKKIGYNENSYSAELNGLQKTLDSYRQTLSDLNNGAAIATKYLSTGVDSQTWQQVQTTYASAQQNYASAASIVTTMMAILGKQKNFAGSGNTGNTTDSTGPNFVDDNGDDEAAAGTIVSKKDQQGRYLITVTSNQAETDIVIKAIKPKAKAIVFNATTDADGNYYLRTTRKLAGYTLQLVLDAEVLAKTAKLK